jgi:hypothetical protein
VGEQLREWDGRIYKKLNTNLVNWAEVLFSYHVRGHLVWRNFGQTE